ncbi:MAG: ABC transporter permease, partial [Pseudomonadales bacterium]
MLETGPIFRAMLRRPAGPLLIILQLAITIAIVSNSLSFIQQRSEFINRDPGFELDGILRFWITQDRSRGDLDNTIEEDLRFLNSLPSVEAAVAMNGLPMGGMGGTSGYATAPTTDVEGQQVNSLAASTMQVTEGWLETLGAKLVQGRNFDFDEYQRFRQEDAPDSSPIIVTEDVAEKLFPDQNPVGQSVYMGELATFTVVGVIENMFGHMLYWETPYQTVIVPKMDLYGATQYLIR